MLLLIFSGPAKRNIVSVFDFVAKFVKLVIRCGQPVVVGVVFAVGSRAFASGFIVADNKTAGLIVGYVVSLAFEQIYVIDKSVIAHVGR